MKQSAVRLILGLTLAGAGGVAAQTPAQTLHDTYCIMCHDSSVYTRENRTAHDYQSLRGEVDRWQSNVSLKWGEDEVDAVATWLAKRYYGFSCPTDC